MASVIKSVNSRLTHRPPINVTPGAWAFLCLIYAFIWKLSVADSGVLYFATQDFFA